MKLGILVNSDRHLDDVVGIARAAVGKQHQVTICVMDEGVRLVEKQAMATLAGLEGVSVSMCSHSARMFGVGTESMSPHIHCGSQLQNAMMNHDADRVIVL